MEEYERAWDGEMRGVLLILVVFADGRVDEFVESKREEDVIGQQVRRGVCECGVIGLVSVV